MAKIDVYLRSIERFGASGAVLSSGQAVLLRFPTGDRNATQVTPHDQLVTMVREVAPPPVLEQIDRGKPGSFEVDAGGARFTLHVLARPNAWQVAIEPAGAAMAAPAASPRQARAQSQPSIEVSDEMPIERGQYAAAHAAPAATRSGSELLDQLTSAARQARASDVILATGSGPLARVGGELQSLGDRGVLDAETIAREIGIVAPAEARAAWTDSGLAVFAYGDGAGRVRATLARDHRGPTASLRLLAEPPALDRLGVSRDVGGWLDRRGLVLVAGASGAGKTTTLAALVRALGERRRRVITFEDPIEIVHTSPTVSQRSLREHAPGLAAGVAGAMREGAEAIVLGQIGDAEAAGAAVDAALAGHLVLAAIGCASARAAGEALVQLLAAERRDLAQSVIVGTVGAVLTSQGRSFETVAFESPSRSAI
jgi:twitching motility protein PilT